MLHAVEVEFSLFFLANDTSLYCCHFHSVIGKVLLWVCCGITVLVILALVFLAGYVLWSENRRATWYHKGWMSDLNLQSTLDTMYRKPYDGKFDQIMQLIAKGLIRFYLLFALSSDLFCLFVP
jgi:hypothetical protein